MDIEDASCEMVMITKQELKLKKALIEQVHRTKGGKMRKIVLSNRGLYETAMPDRTKLASKTEIGLYDKMMEYYGLSLTDYRLKGIWELALEEKENTQAPDSKTIQHLKYEFQRYISNDFANTDIRNIGVVELQSYTQNMLKRISLTDKAFLGYKGVLNIIFNYAVAKGFIATNPAPYVKKSVYQKMLSPVSKAPENKIHTPEEIKLIQEEVRKRMNHKTYGGYFINGFAILFAIETGVRAGEIPSLRWDDIKETHIHIHSQQLKSQGENGSIYRYVPYTKNEKGISMDGRRFPLTDALKDLLKELKSLQEELAIESEYVFCNADGDFIKTDAYETCLRRLCQSLKLNNSNNHAFRMSLNSNVFIPNGIPVTTRARLLGHSVETNLRFYSFDMRDNNDDICALLNSIS